MTITNPLSHTCQPQLDHIDPREFNRVLKAERTRALTHRKRSARAGRKRRSPQRPVGCWRERDLLDKCEIDAFVVIFRTVGCEWAYRGGCSMCGYVNDSIGGVTADDLLAQLEAALERYDDEPQVKIFCSGSFFDPREIPTRVQKHILNAFGARAKVVTVESRPEYITTDRLGDGTAFDHDSNATLEVALGLESATPSVLDKCINKGFTVEEYVDAAERCRAAGARVKSYVLLKPPLLTERQAIDDAVATVRFAADHSQTLSVNPVNIQSWTFIDQLFRAGAYRPPWLWSVVEVLRQTADLQERGVRVLSAPTAGGTPRGAHNCYRCDKVVLRAIEAFSLGYGAGVFDQLEARACDCIEHWRDTLDLELLACTSGWGL